MKTIAICLFIVSVVCDSNGAKILGIFNMPAFSHHHLGNRLLEELAAKGHEVTMISAFKTEDTKNYKTIQVTELLDYFKGVMSKNTAPKGKDWKASYMFSFFTGQILLELTEITIKNNNIQQLLASKEHFDVVIIEQFFNDALKGFCHHFNAPCIMFSTLGANPMVNKLVANPTPLSYVSHIALSYTVDMNIFQRVNNFIFQQYDSLMDSVYFNEQHDLLLKKYFKDSPSVDELNRNTSLVLLNSHPSVNQAVPHVPNMIEIGGYHVKPAKKLPDDLKKYLDNSTDGAIYVSLGSHIKSKDLSIEKRNAFINTFGKLKMNVLWKFEDETLPNKPSNLLISNWFPQNDILGHKNIKLFITHGGLLSTIEAVYHGVPVIGMPVLGDQKLNMASAVSGGFGIKIDIEDLTENRLTEAINKIFTDPKYSSNIKKRSELLKDRPMKPIDTAIYWIEYVIRHKGAPHLNVAGVNMSWYKYYMVDALVLILSAVLLVFYLFRQLYSKLGNSNAFGVLLLFVLSVVYIIYHLLRQLYSKLFSCKTHVKVKKIQ